MVAVSHAATVLPRAQDVVLFWRDAGPARWFDKSPAFDAVFRSRFLPAHEAAARGELDGWIWSREKRVLAALPELSL